MKDRLFGFDTEKIKSPMPDPCLLERELKKTFGKQGFDISWQFSLALEESFVK